MHQITKTFEALTRRIFAPAALVHSVASGWWRMWGSGSRAIAALAVALSVMAPNLVSLSEHGGAYNGARAYNQSRGYNQEGAYNGPRAATGSYNLV